MAQQSLGIGIHDGWVALTLVEKGVRGVRIVGSEWFPLETAQSTEEKKECFVELVTRFLKSGRFHPVHLVVGLPRSEVMVRILNLPAPDKSMLDEIIRLEMDRHFALPLDTLKAGYHIFPKEGHLYPVAAAAIKKETFEKYSEWSTLTGLKNFDMDGSLSSQINILCSDAKLDIGPAAILNVEPEAVEIIITNNRRPVADRVVSLDIPGFQETFFELRFSADAKQELVSACARSIAHALKETMDGCKNLETEESLQAIHVFGGGFLRDDLSRELEDQCAVTTRPPVTPDLINNPMPAEFEPGFQLPSLGWALKPFFKNPVQFHFDDISRPRSKSRYDWAVATALILALMGLWVGISFYKIHGYEQTLLSLNQQLKEVKSDALQLQKIDRRFSDLDLQFETLNAIEKQSPLKLPIISELSRVLPEDTWITAMTIRGRLLKVTGYSTSASELIQKLEDSPVFREVAFQGSVVKRSKNEKFTIHMKLESKLDEDPEA